MKGKLNEWLLERDLNIEDVFAFHVETEGFSPKGGDNQITMFCITDHTGNTFYTNTNATIEKTDKNAQYTGVTSQMCHPMHDDPTAPDIVPIDFAELRDVLLEKLAGRVGITYAYERTQMPFIDYYLPIVSSRFDPLDLIALYKYCEQPGNSFPYDLESCVDITSRCTRGMKGKWDSVLEENGCAIDPTKPPYQEKQEKLWQFFQHIR